MWHSKQATGDLHNEMNADNYEKWLLEKRIPYLLDNSVLVIDNAPSHSRLREKVPNTNTTKESMKSWLRDKGIDFHSVMLKPQLYNLIKLHKKKKV